MNTLISFLADSGTPIEHLSAWGIVDVSVCISLVVLLSLFLCFRINRAWVYVGYLLLDALFIVSLFLTDVKYFPFLAMSFIVILTVVCLNINSGVLRKYLAKSLKSSALTPTNNKKKYDQEKLIKNVVEAVKWLSDNRVGALITFERDTPLDDFMKSGSFINCPFTPEIVETIFYEGTRLHDGAIVVRGDIIVAAGVFYPASTRAITGKFGARHRAALGISEVTDSVTIIVSEETGRVSIAHGGMLDNVKTDEFEKYFRNQIM